MKSEGAIRRQLKQVLYRHLQRRLRANFKKAPHTCSHNHEVELERGTVRICRYTDDRTDGGRVCDVQVDGGARSRDCPFWMPLKSKEDIKVAFRAVLSTGVRSQIATDFPDAAALMWVLDETPNLEEDEPEDEEPEEPAEVVELSSWGTGVSSGVVAFSHAVALDMVVPRRWNWRRWPWSKGESRA